MRFVLAGAAVIGLGIAGWAISAFDILSVLSDEARLRSFLDGLGLGGPLAIIVLRAGAVIVAVVPNSPITLAAGAAYGQAWGTVYVIIGAGAGSVAAFLIARHLGYEALRRWGWVAKVRRSRWGGWLLDRGQSYEPRVICSGWC